MKGSDLSKGGKISQNLPCTKLQYFDNQLFCGKIRHFHGASTEFSYNGDKLYWKRKVCLRRPLKLNCLLCTIVLYISALRGLGELCSYIKCIFNPHLSVIMGSVVSEFIFLSLHDFFRVLARIWRIPKNARHMNWLSKKIAGRYRNHSLRQIHKIHMHKARQKHSYIDRDSQSHSKTDITFEVKLKVWDVIWLINYTAHRPILKTITW